VTKIQDLLVLETYGKVHRPQKIYSHGHYRTVGKPENYTPLGMTLSVVHTEGTQKYASRLLDLVSPLETEDIKYKLLHYEVFPRHHAISVPYLS
jgi:hypothetical protein